LLVKYQPNFDKALGIKKACSIRTLAFFFHDDRMNGRFLKIKSLFLRLKIVCIRGICSVKIGEMDGSEADDVSSSIRQLKDGMTADFQLTDHKSNQ